MKNFAVIKEEVLKVAEPILSKYNLKVYEINNFTDFESDVLQILVEDITQPNKALDFDSIIGSNEEISEALDNHSGLKEPYMLEVASAGIEKTIRNKEELNKSINAFVHIELNDNKTFEGTLVEYNTQDDTFRIAYFIKGQKKKLDFKYEQVKFARYAVKF